MKCKKCGYTSFDYNVVCPKCNRDVSADQKALNLPDFEPKPPFLLGTLTGDDHVENQAGIADSEFTDTLEMEPAGGLAPDGAEGFGARGLDSSEEGILDVDLDAEPSVYPDQKAGALEASADDRVEKKEDTTLSMSGVGASEEEVPFDLEALSEELDRAAGKLAEDEEARFQEEVLDLDELAPEESPSGEKILLNEAEMGTLDLGKKKGGLPDDMDEVDEFELEVDMEAQEDKPS